MLLSRSVFSAIESALSIAVEGVVDKVKRLAGLPERAFEQIVMIACDDERVLRGVSSLGNLRGNRRNLLVFAGSRRLTRRRASLNAVLQKVVTLRHDACRALDIEVVRNYDEKLPRVQSDPLLLHQVFLNMVMNAEHAIAAVGRPGRIEITTAVVGSGDRIVATVRDTGPGIAPDELTRIFEPFYTTKEVGRGTGLGLAIAYGIVREHGGEISAANAPGGGAIFTVELPVKPARAGQA